MAWNRRETGDDRYRIQLKLVGRSGANEVGLRFRLLQIPGIQDVVFDRRAGTFLCYVYAITPVASASVLGLVQDTIDQTVAFPLTGTALNPDLVGITLATTITVVPGSTQTDKDTAAGQAIAATQEYLNNLRVGDQLVINEIAANIRTASTRILDVGQPNRQIELDESRRSPFCSRTSKKYRLLQLNRRAQSFLARAPDDRSPPAST